MRPRKLTAKQRRFVEVYAGNATDAARLAGYAGSDETLGQVGADNLKNPQIAAAIRARQDTEARPLIATRQERQAFWTKVMQGMADFTLEDGSKRELPVEMKDRLKASELLGRSEADFTDKVAGADGGPIQVQVLTYGPGEDEA